MWPRYGVHITVCMARLVFVLVSQCIHALNHPYMSYISFLKSFYGDFNMRLPMRLSCMVNQVLVALGV